MNRREIPTTVQAWIDNVERKVSRAFLLGSRNPFPCETLEASRLLNRMRNEIREDDWSTIERMIDEVFFSVCWDWQVRLERWKQRLPELRRMCAVAKRTVP